MMLDKHIKKKVSIYKYQLLLVDGHSSYVKLDFLDYADKNRIFVLGLFFYFIH